MIIKAKIGTLPLITVRLKGKRKAPRPGDIVTGMKLSLYNSLRYRSNNWETYKVDKAGESHYFLSKL